MFFWKGKGQIPFVFKAHYPSTEKPKALVGFKPRTEPELGTGDSHSTSTPLPPDVIFTPIGHLLGDNSVIDRLRKKGYTVEHIPASKSIEG